MRNFIKDTSGLTVIEVLIGAIIFLIGFSTLIALLAGMSQRVSSKELILAQTVGEQIWRQAQTEPNWDKMSEDTTVVQCGVSFDIGRTIEIADHLKTIRIEVKRRKTGELLFDLYYEALVDQE